MRLVRTAEQEEIRATIERFLAAEMPLARVRAEWDSTGGIDPVLWAACADSGWLGLGLPEDAGGVGLGAVEETDLFRLVGRHLMPGPFLGTVLAAHLACAAGATSLTSELTAGTRRTGIRVGDLVVDARPGDLILELDPACARIVDGAVLEPVDGVGGSTLATAVGGGAVVETESAALVARARLLVAAEAMGVLEAASQMSAEYAKSRVQFGVPIGSFQAVKHRCADTAVDAYACMSLIAYAAHRLDRHAADAPFHAASAFLVAVPAAVRATAANIQNHGAIGFTLEHPAHLFLRRAHVLEHVLGPAKWIEDDLLAPEAHEFI